MKAPTFPPMYSRRNFVGSVAGGIAGTIASPPNVLGASDRVRVGIIGLGERGMQLAREAVGCDNVEVVAVADVWAERRERARTVAPSAQQHSSHEQLLADRSIDAVFIATPPHLHCRHFVDALKAGSHIYVERVMAFDLGQAKRMREEFRQARRVVQVGHQYCSSGHVTDAARFLGAGWLGQITAIRAHTYRNAPRDRPQWTRPVWPGMTPETIDWHAFLGGAPQREFDANRFVNWRLYEDYSGGNVFEGMSQQIAFWHSALDLPIPAAVTMTGGVYLGQDAREVPDTMSVAMEHHGGLLFTWDSGFGNNQLGTGEYLLGSDGTIQRTQQIRYLPQKVNRPEGREVLGREPTEPRAHVRNFLDAVRGRVHVNCPFELGFRVSVACRMALESWRERRTVYWDAEREEIV